jgi:hypothetical protein
VGLGVIRPDQDVQFVGRLEMDQAHVQLGCDAQQRLALVSKQLECLIDQALAIQSP